MSESEYQIVAALEYECSNVSQLALRGCGGESKVRSVVRVLGIVDWVRWNDGKLRLTDAGRQALDDERRHRAVTLGMT